MVDDICSRYNKGVLLPGLISAMCNPLKESKGSTQETKHMILTQQLEVLAKNSESSMFQKSNQFLLEIFSKELISCL